MTMQNPDKPILAKDLNDYHNKILPYLGGLVSSKAGFTPIGTIISVMGTTAPANYLACDGTVYNISDYRELSDYFYQQFGSKNYFGGDGTTTFAVPDLRGEFLRGTGTNSHTNQGSGANVGVHQDATEHVMVIMDAVPSTSPLIYQNGNNNGDKNIDSSISSTKRIQFSASQENATDRGAVFTSRPTNTSVLYCIATKNFYIDPTLDYSTDEKVVGTWINGETIYQKVLEGTTPSAKNNSSETPIGCTIDSLVSLSGFIEANRTGWLSFQNIGSDISTMGITDDKSKVSVYITHDYIISKPIKIIIQYTKATT